MMRGKRLVRQLIMSAAVLAMIMGLVLSPFAQVTAAASENNEMPDPDRSGSIALTFTYFDEDEGRTYPVSGGNSVGLYKVADVVVDNGFKFVLDERFESVGEIPETSEELDKVNLDLAEKMAEIAKGYDFDMGPQKMDGEGKVKFEDLEVGLYLVMQGAKGTGDNEFSILPLLITVPYRNPDGSLSYDVDGSTKPLAVYKAEQPEPSRPGRLPQTGQLWWPVIALGAGGIILVLAGLIRRNRSE